MIWGLVRCDLLTCESGTTVETHYKMTKFKGALGKNSTYLFMSNSIDDKKLNQYRNFQLILSMCFHFMRYSIIFRVSHRLLYCRSQLWKIENARNIHISSKVNQHKTRHAFTTHVNTANGIKSQFFWKKFGDDVLLVQCPFNLYLTNNALNLDLHIMC